MITPPANYTPPLLPETIEVAFGIIKATGNRLLESARLRRLTPPALLPPSGDSSETVIDIAALDLKMALPGSLHQWKLNRIAQYGLGAGHGVYTYIIKVDPINSIWPVSDYWECMRPLDSEDCTAATLTKAVGICFGRMRKIAQAISSSFPHLGTALPSTMPVIEHPAPADLPHIVRERDVVAIVRKDTMQADIYIWNDIAGTPLHIANFAISDRALSWWLSPSALAVRLLRLHSVAEIFPL